MTTQPLSQRLEAFCEAMDNTFKSNIHTSDIREAVAIMKHLESAPTARVSHLGGHHRYIRLVGTPLPPRYLEARIALVTLEEP